MEVGSGPRPDDDPPLTPVPLTPDSLYNLTGGEDFVSPLQGLNTPSSVLLYLFEFLGPVAFVLNLFVLVSCLIILRHGDTDRPSLVFVAHNALLDLVTILFDALVVTDAVTPSLTEEEGAGSLPKAGELGNACRVEQGGEKEEMFTSLLLLYQCFFD